MTVEIAPMGHSFRLVEDFLSLAAWSEYGATTRSYELLDGEPVEGGRALRIGGSGELRIARDTDLTPGEPVVLTYWAWAPRDGYGPCSIQLRNATGRSGFETIAHGIVSDYTEGWTRVIVHATPPEDWEAVRVALFSASGDGGRVARLRAYHTTDEEEA